MTSDKALLRTVLDLVDAIVELYLGNIIKPFLKLHEKLYSALNSTLRSLLDNNKDKIPDWFTANWITYARTVLVIPCVLLLSWGHTLLPSLVVILVDFGDFLDGVVARYWIDIKKEREEGLFKKGVKPRSRSVSPVNSDDDSFGMCRQGTRETELLVVFSCLFRLVELQKSSRLDLLIPCPLGRFLIATARMADLWMLCVIRHL
jgi:hypothetical protein